MYSTVLTVQRTVLKVLYVRKLRCVSGHVRITGSHFASNACRAQNTEHTELENEQRGREDAGRTSTVRTVYSTYEFVNNAACRWWGSCRRRPSATRRGSGPRRASDPSTSRGCGRSRRSCRSSTAPTCARRKRRSTRRTRARPPTRTSARASRASSAMAGRRNEVCPIDEA